MQRNHYRICHLSKYYPPVPGGIETHVRTLAQAQASLGAEVTVVCVNGLNEAGCHSLQTKSIQYQDDFVAVKQVGRLFSMARFDICPEFPKLFFEAIHQSFDIIHLHTPNPTMLLAWVTMQSHIPLVITHHSDIIKQKILKYLLRPIEYLVYSQASRILTTSSHYIQGSRFLQLYNHNLATLPLGLDSFKFVSPSSEALTYAAFLNQQYPGPLWLCVGRLVYYKALHLALEALTLVPGTLIIIGTGPLEKELKKQAQQLGVDSRVVWLGWVDDEKLVGAYHAATALWFPSNARSEGFGMVQVEAMASGCPVINAAIPCSGVAWVSRHEQEGLTVPLNSPNALADAAIRLLTEVGLRDRLVQASRLRAQEFDHLTMAQRSFEIYQQALSVNFSPNASYSNAPSKTLL